MVDFHVCRPRQPQLEKVGQLVAQFLPAYPQGAVTPEHV